MNYQEENDETNLSNEILIRLGVIDTLAPSDKLMLKCLNPEHNDHKPSMSVSMSKGVCHCFSCGYSKKLTSVYYDITGHSIYRDLGIQRRIQFNTYLNREDTVDFSLLPNIDFTFKGQLYCIDYDKDSLSWMKKRGFTKEFCQKSGIYYSPVFQTVKSSEPDNSKEFKYFHNCVVIPIYEQGKLISFEARDVLGEEAWKQSMIKAGKDITKSFYRKVLYPKYSSINTIYDFDKLDKTKPLYITEGLIDMFSLRTVPELANSSCIFHNTPTERQIYLLKQFPKIVYVVDNDVPGLTGCKKLMERIPSKTYFLQPPTRPGIKDVNDILQGKDTVLKSINDLIQRNWLSREDNSLENICNILRIKEKTTN